LDDSSFTLNTLERSEICQKRCFRPFCLLVLGTGAFRARWSAWHEHSAKYAGAEGIPVEPGHRGGIALVPTPPATWRPTMSTTWCRVRDTWLRCAHAFCYREHAMRTR
jgi:hypothetical protein